jgi:hypothetical protein
MSSSVQPRRPRTQDFLADVEASVVAEKCQVSKWLRAGRVDGGRIFAVNRSVRAPSTAKRTAVTHFVTLHPPSPCVENKQTNKQIYTEINRFIYLQLCCFRRDDRVCYNCKGLAIVKKG